MADTEFSTTASDNNLKTQEDLLVLAISHLKSVEETRLFLKVTLSETEYKNMIRRWGVAMEQMRTGKTKKQIAVSNRMNKNTVGKAINRILRSESKIAQTIFQRISHE